MPNESPIQKIYGEAWSFCLFYDFEFFNKRSFLSVVADSFQLLIQGRHTPRKVRQRLKKSPYLEKYTASPIIGTCSMPPRSGKSYVISVCSAWALGRYPTKSLMRNTCTNTLYKKFSYDVRDVLKSPKFSNIFPDVRLSSDKSNVDGWNTNKAKQVSYFGNGVGGTIIGFGANLIAITDDLYKSVDDALSGTINEKVHRWKEGTHDSRIEKNTPSFDIGTRWCSDDVIGKNTEKDKYDIIIKIPALTERDETFCDDVKTTKEYLSIRSDIDTFLWDAEYQQDPSSLEGTVFDKLNYFKLEELNHDTIIAKWSAIDLADKGKDYYADIYCYVADKVYIIDVIYSRSGLEITQPQSISNINTYSIDNTIVETNKDGSLFVRDLRTSCPNTKIYSKFNTQNKIVRILNQSGWIKENFSFRNDLDISKDYINFVKSLQKFNKNMQNVNDDAPDVSALLAFALRRSKIL